MYPIIVLSITGLLTLFLGLSKSRKALLPLTLTFLGVALGSNYIDWNSPGQYFYNMLEVNNMLVGVISILIVTTIFIIALSGKVFYDQENDHPAEYYAIMQFTLVGAIMMVTYTNLVMLFVGLEILSVGLYVLTGSDKRNLRGNEAALKYFLMGSFATGVFLFGVAMFYGGTGSLNVHSGKALAGLLQDQKIFFWIGMFFIFVGLLFKISAAPFHYWTADVYQGAPTLFTGYMATIVKTAGIFALYRIVNSSFALEVKVWEGFIYGVIALSLIFGNINAVVQTNFKRVLAFSSISQAGFMLLSILGIGQGTGLSLGFYSLSYALATVSSFGVLLILSSHNSKEGRPNEDLEIFNGLIYRSPELAFALVVSMLSLSGIPITSGFWSKLYVLSDSASRGYTWLLVLAVLMSVVSLYYYFKPIRASFQKVEGTTKKLQVGLLAKLSILTASFLTLVLGIFPQLFKYFFS